MKKIIKYIISVALACTVIVTLLPTAAQAKAKTKKVNPGGVMETPMYETKLAKDMEFFYKVRAHSVEWGSNYGYASDAEEYAKYLQKKITTPSEFMYWLTISGYNYNEIEGMMGYVRDGWSVNNSPVKSVEVGFGVCCETSNLFIYMLGDDYEEAGFVLVTGDYGHQYNYVKNDGKYYLIDFTDYTSWHEGGNYDEIWDRYKDSICFWSGDSLKSKSAKEAACQHDNYEDGRQRYNINVNKAHTAAIIAVPYFKGLYVPPSTYRDDCYQLLDKGVEINGKSYYLNEVQMGFQKGVLKKSYVFFLNDDYKGAKWTLVDIPVKEIPWFCNMVPKTDKENNYKKMLRQLFVDGRNGDWWDCSHEDERGMRRGLFIKLMRMNDQGLLNDMTSSEICKKYNLRTKY